MFVIPHPPFTFGGDGCELMRVGDSTGYESDVSGKSTWFQEDGCRGAVLQFYRGVAIIDTEIVSDCI